MIFPGGFGRQQTSLERVRAWRMRRRAASHGTTALGIAHHQGMVEALRIATDDGRARTLPHDDAR